MLQSTLKGLGSRIVSNGRLINRILYDLMDVTVDNGTILILLQGESSRLTYRVRNEFHELPLYTVREDAIGCTFFRAAWTE